MTKYFIRHTDINKAPKEVGEGSVDETSLDIALFGRIRLEYGERLNRNVLNLLENFAVGMDPNLIPPTPTPMPSFSATPLPSAAATVTPTASPTPTPVVGSSPTPTPTRTGTPVAETPAVTPTRTSTPTPTKTPAATSTATPSATPPSTPAVTSTVTPTPSMVSPINLSAIPSNIVSNNATAGADATLTFMVDGTWVAYKNASIIGSGIWLTSGSTADYEFYYTYVDNSSPSYGDPGPGAGVWQNFPITLGVDDSDSSTAASVFVTYTIRNKANTSLQSSKYISLNANGRCFAYGTLIKTTSGYSKVEDLRVGDTVLGFNIDGMVPESNGMWREWNTTDISTLEIKPVTVVSAISFNDFSYVNINGIISTMDHVYFVESDGKFCWKNASDLTTSDKLVSPSGDLIDIYQIEVSNEPNKFVALDVSPYDTLIVNNGIKDILAHNISE